LQERVIFAGSGGQGVMLLGKILARAMMEEGKNVTYFPSYGTEVRGGTANCQVVISDEEIYSPLVEQPTSLIAMNAPSYRRFAGRLSPSGLLIVNTSLFKPDNPVGDVDLREVPATELANSLGDTRVANVVMLGAYNAVRQFLPVEKLFACLRDILSGKAEQILLLNRKALQKGAEWVNK